MVTIRTEESRDLPAIASLLRSAFRGEKEVRLVERVRATPEFIPDLSLVAVTGRQVVGHALFSPLAIRGAGREWPVLTLAPLGVLPECQRKGIGSRLMEAGLRRCRELGHRIVIVVGHPSYYPRFGFVLARGRGLEVPFPCPDEAFMVLELVPGALDGISGPAGSRDRPGGKGPLWSGITGMVCFPPFFLEGIPE